MGRGAFEKPAAPTIPPTVLFRFSLYGFLKNQRYFEPFLVLAFLEKGLTFFSIGCLLAFREIATNLLEIPSGAIADLLGRRRAMITSFTGYLASFLVFGLSNDVWALWPAMLLFSVGEAFRTGTHKAMIFAWLRREGRTDERTRVYGFTRSWSKLGSATSVVFGAVFVFVSDGYSAVFLFAAVPCAANIVNFLGYPADLDGERTTRPTMGDIVRHTIDGTREAIRLPALRRLVGEAMGFEGVFHAAKDYLQPLLFAVATIWTATWAGPTEELSAIQRSTLWIGPIYFALHVGSSIASRRAHRVVDACGGEERAARALWLVAAALFLILFGSELGGLWVGSILAFVGLHVVQNLWRPILISRFDTHSDPERAATTLSVESQARRLATVVLAPLFGLCVDAAQRSGAQGPYWMIGLTGSIVALAMFGTARNRDG